MDIATNVDRMRRTAREYIADAELLSHAASESNSAHLLRLTALEILLKATLLVHSGSTHTGHGYARLFEKLPPEVRVRVCGWARERYGPHADLSEFNAVLEELGQNFVRVRYPYEAYDTLSVGEYEALGVSWVAEGAELQSAKFRYFPMEIDAIIYALSRELEVGHPGGAGPKSH